MVNGDSGVSLTRWTLDHFRFPGSYATGHGNARRGYQLFLIQVVGIRQPRAE
jgi:hypothetical protein